MKKKFSVNYMRHKLCCCYSEKRLMRLWGEKKSISMSEILSLNIPNKDKMWFLSSVFYDDEINSENSKKEVLSSAKITNFEIKKKIVEASWEKIFWCLEHYGFLSVKTLAMLKKKGVFNIGKKMRKRVSDELYDNMFDICGGGGKTRTSLFFVSLDFFRPVSFFSTDLFRHTAASFNWNGAAKMFVDISKKILKENKM